MAQRRQFRDSSLEEVEGNQCNRLICGGDQSAQGPCVQGLLYCIKDSSFLETVKSEGIAGALKQEIKLIFTEDNNLKK